jgi:RimJ/RimL family protein N-acetyltransferase
VEGKVEAAMPIALRQRSLADDELHFTWQADPVQVKTTVPARSRPDFEAWLAKISSEPTNLIRTITRDGAMVGTINTFFIGHERFIGYRVGNEHWGQGIATEAIRLMIQVDAHRPLLAVVLTSNVASVKALLRNGFAVIRTQDSTDGPETVLGLNS